MAPKSDKPKAAASAYAFFVKTCREEHRKKHPNESVGFQEFSKKCAEKWKTMTPKEKKKFEDMANKDKARYLQEKANWIPPKDGGITKGKKRKAPKDPNAPKRALSAFFMFCKEERPKVMKEHPEYKVGDIGKELGKRWEACTDRAKFEELAKKDKERYAKEMEVYQKGGKKSGTSSPKKGKAAEPEPESDEEDDDEEESD